MAEQMNFPPITKLNQSACLVFFRSLIQKEIQQVAYFQEQFDEQDGTLADFVKEIGVEKVKGDYQSYMKFMQSIDGLLIDEVSAAMKRGE